MNKNKSCECPICNFGQIAHMIDINCGNFDASTLYQKVSIGVCQRCGHVYNILSTDEIAGLLKYYNEEYAPSNLGSPDIIGDRPGSDNQNTVGRYDQLYDLMSAHINKDLRILDIGCATGGFLDYLKEKGFHELSGIDVADNYLCCAKEKNKYTVKHGCAESIPFDSRSFDLLVMDQVLEHSAEPRKVFQEAKRVLADKGLFCIGIPDASRYDKVYFFDFFWFLMREHIQHFDIEHLRLLAEREGFDLIGFSKSEIPMMSEKMVLPNLNVIFRLIGAEDSFKITKDRFRLKEEINAYVANESGRLVNKKKIISGLIESGRPVYAWGIGREFLYLYESAGLRNCSISGLIDTNSYKQNNFTLDGKKIVGAAILTAASRDSILIITAIAHINQIKKTLIEIGYGGEVLTFE